MSYYGTFFPSQIMPLESFSITTFFFKGSKMCPKIMPASGRFPTCRWDVRCRRIRQRWPAFRPGSPPIREQTWARAFWTPRCNATLSTDPLRTCTPRGRSCWSGWSWSGCPRCIRRTQTSKCRTRLRCGGTCNRALFNSTCWLVGFLLFFHHTPSTEVTKRWQVTKYQAVLSPRRIFESF